MLQHTGAGSDDALAGGEATPRRAMIGNARRAPQEILFFTCDARLDAIRATRIPSDDVVNVYRV
jgi:hypothetical protein